MNTKPDDLQAPWLDMMRTLSLAATVSAASSSGLLAEVMGPLQPAEEYARKLGLDGRAVHRVLTALAAFGMIQQEENRFGLAPTAGLEFLFLPKVVQGLLEQFAQLPHFLKTGTPIAWMDESLQQCETTYSQVAADMGRGFAAAAVQLAAKLDLQPRSILDVGYGSGVWSLAIAARFKDAHVTGLDFPAVVPAFEDRARALGCSDRIATLPGNMWELEIPIAQFDLVVLANVLRLVPAASAGKLVSRLATAIKPGGRMLLIDAFAHGTPEKNLLNALYSLHLALRTRSGQTHAPAQAIEWMQSAGFTSVTEIDCGLHIAAIGALLGVHA